MFIHKFNALDMISEVEDEEDDHDDHMLIVFKQMHPVIYN